MSIRLSLTGLSPSLAGFPKTILLGYLWITRSIPQCARTLVWALPVSLAATPGIDVSYSSSPYLDVSVQEVPLHTLCIGVWIPLMWWVSPFRYLRINGYLLLPEAFRSLSRLSSALSAKASTLRSSSLDLVAIRFAPVQSLQAVTSLALRDCSFSAKMGFLRIMTTRVVMTVYHSPSHLCVDNSWYIALYAVICFWNWIHFNQLNWVICI